MKLGELRVVDGGEAQCPPPVGPFVQQSKPTAFDGAARVMLGCSGAIHGITVVGGAKCGYTIRVGAFGDNIDATADQGSACVFVKSGAGWPTSGCL